MAAGRFHAGPRAGRLGTVNRFNPQGRCHCGFVTAGVPHAHTARARGECFGPQEKFLARLLLVFALVAVTLAAAGVFGLMSYSTERATHDFGVRMALGAQPRHVLWMVLRKGLMLAIVGL